MGKWLLLAAIAVLIGLGAGAYSLWNEQRQETIAVEQETIQEPVREARIRGILSSPNVVNIPAPIEGILDTVMINVGSEVYQNQLIAQVINTGIEDELRMLREEQEEAQAAVNDAESKVIAARLEASRAEADYSHSRERYDQAQANAARQRMLYREGATPKLVYQKAQDDLKRVVADFEAAEATWKQAEDRVEYARRDLEQAKGGLDNISLAIEEVTQELQAAQITSPVSGIVTGMAARQGEDIHPGMDALFQIATDLTRMNVILEPSPAELELLHPGMTVYIEVPEVWGDRLQGTVIDMNIDRTVVAFANPSPQIRPGLNATVIVTL